MCTQRLRLRNSSLLPIVNSRRTHFATHGNVNINKNKLPNNHLSHTCRTPLFAPGQTPTRKLANFSWVDLKRADPAPTTDIQRPTFAWRFLCSSSLLLRVNAHDLGAWCHTLPPAGTRGVPWRCWLHHRSMRNGRRRVRKVVQGRLTYCIGLGHEALIVTVCVQRWEVQLSTRMGHLEGVKRNRFIVEIVSHGHRTFPVAFVSLIQNKFRTAHTLR